LGVSCPTIVRRWKSQQLAQAGPVADVMDARVKELENELRRVERERDVLKKALIIFGRDE
jgi:transposase